MAANDVKALAKKLRALSSEQFSQATADAINSIAIKSFENQKTVLQEKFTIRNKYTMGSLKMFKASPKKDANKIDALVGSKSPYLGIQEVGGNAETSRGKQAVAMPSVKSRRGNWSKAVSANFRMNKITAIGRRKGGKMVPKGTPYFFLEGGRLKNKTLFERRGKRMIRVRVITRGPIKLKPSHWHSEAMAKHGNATEMSAAWRIELIKALTKLGAK